MSFANTLPAPFQVTPQMTAIAIAYTNEKMIADAVLPRVPVDTPDFNYSKFNQQDSFTVPDTKVGRKSAVNEVDYSATLASSTVEDQALDEVVPRRDQQVAAAYGNFIDPKNMATEQVSDLLALSREVRVAGLVFNPNSFSAANKTTLDSTSQWDNPDADPAEQIQDAMDTMLMRPNQLVIGRAVYSSLRRNPNIVKAFNQNLGDKGVVPMSFLTEYLELDEILVGEGWVNTAKKGQTPNLVRVWGKSAALLYKKTVSMSTQSMSFGITAQWGSRIAGTYFDEKKGMRGSDIVRVGESVKEVILATDLGYLFQSAVA